MDSASRVLFDGFPRRLGTPSQFWAFSQSWFDTFVNDVDGRRNAYATVGRLRLGGPAEVDKVMYDLDGDKDALPADSADENIALMRSDPDLADSVLGDVVDEARALAERSAHDGIPVVGVFSGFGIHIHQLYQPTRTDTRKKMASTSRRYETMLDITTIDERCEGQPDRLCRIPNVQRVTFVEDQYGRIQDGRKTGLWTIPIGPDELQELTVDWLLRASDGPRTGFTAPDGRPRMGVFEDHLKPGDVASERNPREIDEYDGDDRISVEVEVMLEELLKMPCMVRRLQQPNPGHDVRVNAAVMLFNCGLNPQEVHQLFRRLHWTDFHSGKTKKHLKQIYRHGYSDMSCSTLRKKGLCVVDEHDDCETFGWAGGRCEWR